MAALLKKLRFTMTESLRLSRRVHQLFECSRREAELLIEGGWVMVDGAVEESPLSLVSEAQVITLDPDASADPVEPVTILLHKPAGYDVLTTPVSTLLDAASRSPDDRLHQRVLKKHFINLRPVLILETDAGGLQVFSQEPRIVRKLVEDACKIEQEYIVEVSGTIAPNGLATLNLSPAKVSWQNETRLRFALKEPKPGQIAHMCASVGLQALSIKRIRLGSRAMGPLLPGQWRYLPTYEKF